MVAMQFDLFYFTAHGHHVYLKCKHATTAYIHAEVVWSFDDK